MSGIVQYDGLYWPADDRKARQAILRDRDPAMAAILRHVSGRECVVQAGGNVGVYPLALADHFHSVITAEPDPTNWRCLSSNLAARDSLKRIRALNAGFGEVNGVCDMVVVEPGNCGAHRIQEGAGDIALVTIDSLVLPTCDLIWLDIEGGELAALKGAVETLARCKPVVAIEDKGLDAAYGVRRGETVNWLGFMGYEQVDQIGRDKVFRRTA